MPPRIDIGKMLIACVAIGMGAVLLIVALVNYLTKYDTFKTNRKIEPIGFIINSDKDTVWIYNKY